MSNGEFYILAATIVLVSALTRYVAGFYYQVLDAVCTARRRSKTG